MHFASIQLDRSDANVNWVMQGAAGIVRKVQLVLESSAVTFQIFAHKNLIDVMKLNVLKVVNGRSDIILTRPRRLVGDSGTVGAQARIRTFSQMLRSPSSQSIR
ncbi:unnamed protein product [Anisakis simplex]|uniref:Uncharacterized protein n=1 Tax=Anisakis simplex TaxID=6269 RepID=A0A0M3KB79_ANISI|nr:unnamed protein product [Anisakis simplex]